MMDVPYLHRADGIFDGVILLAEDDAVGHDLGNRRGSRIHALGGRACRDVLLCEDSHETPVLTDRETTDVLVAHSARSLGEGRGWRSPLDAPGHQLMNIH